MKTNIVKNIRVSVIAIAAIAFVTVSNVAVAANNNGDTVEKPVAVKYLGTNNAQPIFQLDVKNEAAEDLVISLENIDGDVLYTQRINSNFTKKIQLETTDTEINLNLYVYSPKTKTKQLYQINKVTKTNFVEDVVVNVKKS